MFELGADQSYWTPEYATCYIVAPLVGGFMAGNLFVYMKIMYMRIEYNLHDDTEGIIEADDGIHASGMKKNKKIKLQKEQA